MQRGLPAVVPRVDTGAVVQEKTRDDELAFVGRVMKRRVSVSLRIDQVRAVPDDFFEPLDLLGFFIR